MRLPLSVEPYRQDIRRFVDAMVYKLAKNAHKGRWEGFTSEMAAQRMIEEVVEMMEAMKAGNTVEIMLEAADVANFAMIASSITVEKGE